MPGISISHRDLIEGLIASNRIPRLPVAFWRHFPIDDQSPDRLSAATTLFQNTYDPDIIKVSPSSSFCIREWGISDEWSGNTEGTRDYTNSLSLDEAQEITVQDVMQGSLGKQLSAIEMIIAIHAKTTPVIQTIFSPLSQLKNLLGKKNLAYAIRHHPAIISGTLDVITETTKKFMLVCTNLGVDGFFYAVQHATSYELSREEFIQFGKNFDIRLFDNLNKHWVNILHIHGSHIYFDLMLDYPCQIFNWHDREGAPNLLEASRLTDKVLCGGLNRISAMVQGNEEQIESEILDAVSQIGGKHFLLGAGCVLSIIAPHGKIIHAVNFARRI